MASQLFYKLVTEKTAADCDQDHVRMVIYSDSSMPDRTGAILSGEYDKVYSQLLEDAKVLENCRETPGAKVAVLATDGTIKTGLYQKHMEAAGLTAYAPSEEIQKEVMYQIYDRIKSGLVWDAASWDRIEEAVKSAGCQKAIMACTELSVIKADNGLSDFYVDPMEVLAEKVILFSGRRLK